MSERAKRATPPFMIRRVVLFCASMTLAGGMGFFGLLPAIRGKTGWILAAQGVMFAAMAGITFWFVVGFRGVLRRARESDGKVCWRCGYSLCGLADAGACPECGDRYELPELRRRWMPEAHD